MSNGGYSANEMFIGTLSLISKSDTARIVDAIAESGADGLKADLNTHASLDLTKKQYYTRIKQMSDYGLVYKENGRYHFTARGNEIVNPIKKIHRVYEAIQGDLGNMSPQDFNKALRHSRSLGEYLKIKGSTSTQSS